MKADDRLLIVEQARILARQRLKDRDFELKHALGMRSVFHDEMSPAERTRHFCRDCCFGRNPRDQAHCSAREVAASDLISSRSARSFETAIASSCSCRPPVVRWKFTIVVFATTSDCSDKQPQ